MEKIDEGNKLIQDFLGWKLICLNPEDEEEDKCYEFRRYDEDGIAIGFDFGGDSWGWDKDNIIPFNTSWDRLKPAIDKCFVELEKLGISRKDRGGWTPQYGYSPNLLSLGIGCTLEQAWESVVFSINFINEKNKR